MRNLIIKILCAMVLSGAIFANTTLNQAHANDLGMGMGVEEEGDQVLSKTLTMGGVAATHAALYTWAYFAWYKGRSLTDTLILRDEGLFGIDTYAGGADKLGHMYSNYVLTRGTSQLLQYGGWDRTTSSLMAGGLTAAFFTAIELKDGYHKGFGFSWGDMGFNAAGIGLALVMENIPSIDRMFDLKVEYVPTDLFIQQLIEDGLVDAAEDYSGQTFMLSYHLASIKALSESKAFGWTRYVDLSVGFKATNYLPTPVEPGSIPKQDLFLGASVNVQQVINDLFFPNPNRRGTGHGVLEFTNEVVAIPYTTLPLINLSRDASLLGL